MDMALACFLNPSGLSRVARSYYRMFKGLGFRVVPIWMMEPSPEGVDPELAKEMLSASNWPLEDDPLQFYVGSAYALRVLKQRRALLGSMVFENRSLLPRQIQSFRALDAILAPSMFCRNACLSSGMPRSKVFYLSYPIGHEWDPSTNPEMGPGGKFRFLFINTWYGRKGCDVLMRAWWRAFSAADPVELWIKTYKEEGREPDIGADVSRMAREAGVDRGREAHVRIVDEILPDSRLPGFMRSFDCLVSPHRSEGFGMNVWHAMAIGLPVICTDYGGCIDFARPDTAWLVKTTGMSSPNARELSIFPHLEGISWAEPDVHDMAMAMRAAWLNPAERTKRATRGIDLVRMNYSVDVISDDFRRIMTKVSPGTWDALAGEDSLARLASQPAPRYESPDKPVRLVEL